MTERTQDTLVVMPTGPERDLVERTLRAMDLRAVAAEGLHPATAMTVEQPFDLVVLSIEGLGPRDHAFLEEVGRRAPHVRVLLLVPEGRRRDAIGFLAAGADARLDQPFFVDEFRILVRSLLRYEAADPLTGLANRPAFELALPREVTRADRDHASLALGLLDIDHFRAVNRDLLYQGANEVLQQFAARLRPAFRTTDFVARWGGEEFVVLAGGFPAEPGRAWKEALRVFERARAVLSEEPYETRAGSLRSVTFSGGVALFPPDLPGYETAEGEYLAPDRCRAAGHDLFTLANERLKVAKDEGRDRIVYGRGIAPPPRRPRKKKKKKKRGKKGE